MKYIEFDGDETVTIKCDDCEMIEINGVWCHETPCPSLYLEPECGLCGDTMMHDGDEEWYCDCTNDEDEVAWFARMI